MRNNVDISNYLADAEKKRSNVRNFKEGGKKTPKPYSVNVSNTTRSTIESLLFGDQKTMVKQRVNNTEKLNAADSAKPRGVKSNKKYSERLPRAYKMYTSDLLSPVKTEDSKVKMEVYVNKDLFLNELQVSFYLKNNIKRLKKGDKLCLIFKPL